MKVSVGVQLTLLCILVYSTCQGYSEKAVSTTQSSGCFGFFGLKLWGPFWGNGNIATSTSLKSTRPPSSKSTCTSTISNPVTVSSSKAAGFFQNLLGFVTLWPLQGARHVQNMQKSNTISKPINTTLKRSQISTTSRGSTISSVISTSSTPVVTKATTESTMEVLKTTMKKTTVVIPLTSISVPEIASNKVSTNLKLRNPGNMKPFFNEGAPRRSHSSAQKEQTISEVTIIDGGDMTRQVPKALNGIYVAPANGTRSTLPSTTSKFTSNLHKTDKSIYIASIYKTRPTFSSATHESTQFLPSESASTSTSDPQKTNRIIHIAPVYRTRSTASSTTPEHTQFQSSDSARTSLISDPLQTKHSIYIASIYKTRPTCASTTPKSTQFQSSDTTHTSLISDPQQTNRGIYIVPVYKTRSTLTTSTTPKSSQIHSSESTRTSLISDPLQTKHSIHIASIYKTRPTCASTTPKSTQFQSSDTTHTSLISNPRQTNRGIYIAPVYKTRSTLTTLTTPKSFQIHSSESTRTSLIFDPREAPHSIYIASGHKTRPTPSTLESAQTASISPFTMSSSKQTGKTGFFQNVQSWVNKLVFGPNSNALKASDATFEHSKIDKTSTQQTNPVELNDSLNTRKTPGAMKFFEMLYRTITPQITSNVIVTHGSDSTNVIPTETEPSSGIITDKKLLETAAVEQDVSSMSISNFIKLRYKNRLNRQIN